MKVLLVDDFPAIVKSLEQGVNWEAAGVSRLYTANSAREARLVLMNFDVDVLLCDIEMPEENGLELAQWTIERFPDIECIFLTSHAEFEFVQQALRMKSFDYILQPVEFTNVEKVLRAVYKKIQEKKKQNKLTTITQRAIEQGDQVLNVMLTRLSQGKTQAANQACSDYRYICSYYFKKILVFPVIISVVRWKKVTRIRNNESVLEILYNTGKALFEENTVRIAAAESGENHFWFLFFCDGEKVTSESWKEKIKEFYDFVENNLDFEIAIYPSLHSVENDYVEEFLRLRDCVTENTERKKGIIINKPDKRTKRTENPAIEESISYIRKNLNKNLSRAEVAQMVHLSEEYYSRLFKQETGIRFKEYVLSLKMEEARDLLIKTKFSVSIVASKVGYSNFSHFSQTFKNYTGYTPQEYRKQFTDC